MRSTRCSIARTVAALLLFVSTVSTASAQIRFDEPDASGGRWGFAEPPAEHIPEAEQQALWDGIQKTIAQLEAAGRIAPLKAAAAIGDVAVRFSWPTRFAPGRPEFFDHVIVNYVDHDRTSGSFRDHTCGNRTYDGHNGTDITVGQRPFYLQDTEQVIIIAAAPGVIVAKDDASPDRSCAIPAGVTLKTNVISVRHNDGSIALYYHLKTGSATPKKIGDAVDEGEYLGVIGSSGYSTEPHLHFEVRDAAGAVVSPWQGTCNLDTSVSLWKNAEPYRIKEVLTVIPSTVGPSNANLSTPCVNSVADNKPASGYLQPNFHAQPGVLHYFTGFFRDVEVGDQIVYSTRRPDGTEHSRFPITATGTGALAVYVTTRSIAASEPAGQWTMTVTYGGKTQSMPFFFRVPAPAAARVFEFHHAGLDHYFRTANAAEAQGLAPSSGFLPTGDDFMSLDRLATAPGASPVCRFYGSVDPGPNSHFYTANAAECDGLKTMQAQTPPSLPRWNYEETAFNAVMPVNGVCPHHAPFPIYRLYNNHRGETFAGRREDSNHRFTSLFSTYYRMALTGWAGEGVVMCAQSKP